MDASKHAIIRRRIDLRGQVQGVGFRPFIYRLARSFGLVGYVVNNTTGARVEVQGRPQDLEALERALEGQLPPLARIAEMSCRDIAPRDEVGFRIDASRTDENRSPEVTPDAATCPECLAELLDPTDRRYRYPFINCTNCGPRYSIIRTIPYDRPATTMAEFAMCPPCSREYADPGDRRFHAQPDACPECGPGLELCRPDRQAIDGDPVRVAAGMLRDGKVLAVKGIGGYHLACRADLQDVVLALRERKLRDGKPLAVMVPDLDAAQRICRLSEGDCAALSSAPAPIVLVSKRRGHGLAEAVGEHCATFGIMLPYAPVHHLLFGEGLGPLVMTSANLAGQPLTFEEDEAFAELGEVADAFLIHNRRIFRPIDDSVVFTFRESVAPLRRARGYAPQPLRLARRTERSILAVGGELKSTVCLYRGGEAVLSEHLGDLTRPEAYRHFVGSIDRFMELFAFRPQLVAHDLHPRYLSTEYARNLELPIVAVQHHHAHVVSVMAEWDVVEPVIGLSCDGVGYGIDGAAWGGEVLRCDAESFDRVAHLEYFPLVGGDRAAIETWRPAAALLRQAFGNEWRDHAVGLPGRFPARDLAAVDQLMQAGINSPPTSSLGRVFDAVSFLLGLCDRNRHEAEAAMALEAVAGDRPAEPYSFVSEAAAVSGGLSLAPALVELVEDLRTGREPGEVSARFHETVARMLVAAAVAACEAGGLSTAALSGGCFANRRLLSRVVELLEDQHLSVLYHRQVPCGDGGLSLGQAVAAAAICERDEPCA